MSRSFRSGCLDSRVNGTARSSVLVPRRAAYRAEDIAPMAGDPSSQAASEQSNVVRRIAGAIRANPEQANELVSIAISHNPKLAHRILVESIKQCPSAAAKILAAARLSRSIGARLVLGAVLLLVCQKLFGADAQAQGAEGAVPEAGPGGMPGQMAAFLAGLNAALALMPGRAAQSDPVPASGAEALEDAEGHDGRDAPAAPLYGRSPKTSAAAERDPDSLDFDASLLGDGEAVTRAHAIHTDREADVEAVFESRAETDNQPAKTPSRESAPAARRADSPPIDGGDDGMRGSDPAVVAGSGEHEAAPIQDWLMRQHARSDNFLVGDAADDVFYGGAGSDLVIGAAGNDRLFGGNDDDLLVGDSGDDLVFGGQGVDDLYGGDGDDRIGGSSGNDKLDGGAGDDLLSGGAGADLLDGDDGDDLVNGGSGRDTIYGGAGSDRILGGSDDDTVFGSDGDDMADGGIGNDLLDGEIGNDILSGGAGSDILSGGFGGDILDGGSGNDILLGGDGEDWLSGGQGSDELDGGAGSDTYVISASDDGIDVISDSEGSNWLRIEGYPAEAAVLGELQPGGDLLVLVVTPDDGEQAVVVIEDFEAEPEALAGVEINGRQVSTDSLTLGTDTPVPAEEDVPVAELSQVEDAVPDEIGAEDYPIAVDDASIGILADEIGQNVVQLLNQAPGNSVWAQITEDGDLDILVRDDDGHDELAARLEGYLDDPGALAGVEINGRSLSVEDLIAGLDLIGETSGTPTVGNDPVPPLPPEVEFDDMGDIASIMIEIAAAAAADPRLDDVEAEDTESMGL